MSLGGFGGLKMDTRTHGRTHARTESQLGPKPRPLLAHERTPHGPGTAPAAPPAPPPHSNILEWGGVAIPRDENFLREEGGRLRHSVLCQSVSKPCAAGVQKTPIFAPIALFALFHQNENSLKIENFAILHKFMSSA